MANQNRLATSLCSVDRISTKAMGSTIWLNDQPYLDFASGPGVANVGWNHPEVKEAISRVYCANEAGWGGNMLMNKYQVQLAEQLCELTPGTFPKKVFFSNSGTEAVGAAIFACMKRRPERTGMLSFIGDFHGRLGYSRTATTSKPLHVEGLPWGVQRAFFLIFPAQNPETPEQKQFLEKFSKAGDYLNYVENTIGPFINEINFALFEIVQGEGGINIAYTKMIQELFQYLRDNDVWIIVDEVQSGLGRTGVMWVSDIYNVEPDILTVAKALSGGVVPIGATILRESLDYRKPGEHCNTFGGSSQACAAGLAMLEILKKQNLCYKSLERGVSLRAILKSAVANNPELGEAVTDISGIGLMSRLTFRNIAIRDAAVTEAFKRGLFLMGAGHQSVRLMPPLTITEAEIGKATKIIAESLSVVHTG